MFNYKNLNGTNLENNKDDKNKKNISYDQEKDILKQYLIKTNNSPDKIIKSKYTNANDCLEKIKCIVNIILSDLVSFYRETSIEIYKCTYNKNLILEDLKKTINIYDNISITFKTKISEVKCKLKKPEVKYEIEAELNINICEVKVYKTLNLILFDDLEFVFFKSQLNIHHVKFKVKESEMSDFDNIKFVEDVEINCSDYNIVVICKNNETSKILNVSFKTLFDLYNFTGQEIPEHVLLNEFKVDNIKQVVVGIEYDI